MSDSSLGWWQAFKLLDRQRAWEAAGAAAAARQDESAASRKSLADQVRAFKKLSEAEQPSSFPGLLKAFQDEVDSLTRRAKAAEKELLSVFSEVLDAPDPAPLLTAADEARAAAVQAAEELTRLRAEAARCAEENGRLKLELAAAAERASTADAATAECSRLRGELEEAESELRKLTNQDITIRDLERRLGEFESVVDESVAARLAEREQQLRAAFESELEGVREAELAAEAHAAQLRVALAEATAARDEAQAQLFASKRGGGSGVASGSGPMDMGAGYSGEGGSGSGSSAVAAAASAAAAAELHLENGRLRSTIAALTAQLQQVSSQALLADGGSVAGSGGEETTADVASGAAAVGGGVGASLRAQLSAYQARLASLEHDLSTALSAQSTAAEEVRRWQDRAQALRASAERSGAAHEAAQAERERELAKCRGELLRRPTKAALALARQRCRLLARLIEQLGLTAPATDGAFMAGPGFSSSSSAAADQDDPTADGAAGDDDVDDARAEAEAAAVFAGVPSALVHSIGQLRSALTEEAARRADALAASERAAAAAATAEAARSAAEDRASRMEEALIARAVSGSAASAAGAGAAVSASAVATPQVAVSEAAGRGAGGCDPQESSALHLAAVLRSPGPSLPGSQLFSSPATPARPAAATTADLLAGAGAGAASGPADAVLVLHAQREKLRARVLELEEEVQLHAAEALEARARAEKLLEDNVKLIAKIRFLEAYGHGQGQSQGHGQGQSSVKARGQQLSAGSGASGYSMPDSHANPLPLVLAGAGASSGSRLGQSAAGGQGAAAVSDAEVEAPYRRLYMESHDPFTDFRRREKQSQLERLSTAERITLTSSRFFLGSKLARNFLFAWVCVTHLLVFLMLWHFTHVSHGGSGCEAGAAADAVARPGGGPYAQQRFLPSALRGGTTAAAAAVE